MMLYRLVTNSDSRAYKHIVIALSGEGGMVQWFNDANVDLIILDFKHSPISGMARLISAMVNLRPNIVQTWMYHADLLGGLAARISGQKNIVWGIRTTDVSAGGPLATARVRWLCACLSRWVPHTIVCAAEASRRVHVALGYRADRMVVVPNGFDLLRLQVTPSQVAALRSACGFSADTVVIGTLGRFNAVKDPHNYVRAAGLLARDYPQAQFLMVGRDCDAANAKLMAWIKATGFENRFVLLGERSDVPVCLAAMDMFCLSSRTEGFPNVVGEAMAMRKACVVTDVGDAAYLLGGCGVVVPKEDSVALAEGMVRMLDLSIIDRAELGERAHARIASEFTMQRTCERFEAVYANVLAGRPSQHVNKKNKQG